LLRRLLVTFVATASIVLAGLGTGPVPPTSAAEVARRVRQCDQAWARSDVAALDGLLAERYVHADGRGGVQRREAWLADAGRPRNVAITCDDLLVAVHGRIAVVTGSDVITTPERAETLRFTQVWVNRGAGWRRAAFRAVPSPAPLAPVQVPLHVAALAVR
jgi:ketosteroid isomerase-like protein